MSELMAPHGQSLPVGGQGERSNGWWGMVAMIATEASVFSYLIFSYLYLAVQATQHWPPEGMPKIGIGTLNTCVLLLSSVFVWLAERLVRRRRPGWAAATLACAIVLGMVFLGIQFSEWHHHPYGISTHQYGSLYFTMTGFHVVHVLVGLLILMFLLIWTCLGYFDENRHTPLKIGGLYWHFVDAVWLFIFTTLYVTPFLF